ncbi:MAG: zf-HC2 domain-containing protein [Chroococcidiopsidaceae cyanobacterium CP_BM_RX_35]|nr:zf-HC2 domain-containing protein [Chroococcidiopsidaceae cyanobacterium CP_BM_RX_35]
MRLDSNSNMTSKFESQDSSRINSQEALPQSLLKRDRFELLSAYLDGEVSAAERRQVETWLTTDPGVQRLYGRLINLRQSLQTMPVPSTQQPAAQTAQQVFARLDRPRKTAAWGGTVIAALFVGALSGIFPTYILSVNQVARTLNPAAKHETLTVALNTPIVEIPKAPEKPVKPVQSQSPQRINQNVY